MNPEQFIARWQHATGSELANAQSFVRELAELLGEAPPNPAREDTRDNDYVFERRVIFRHGDGQTSEGRIDCYRRGHFVLEAKKLKQGPRTKGFDDALLRARSQAENYARALPADEGRPPFLVVVDVGHVIELYAEFTRSGATYTPFPDPRSHRIRLADLADEKVRARLKAIWADPLSLDPTRASARATREIADRLAGVAKALEAAGHGAERVAGFLTRCLFSLFAEDVGLLPKRSFTGLLDTLSRAPEQFVPMVGALWREMDAGGFSVILRDTLPRFNGKLFKQPDVLPLDRAQIDLLREAGQADWTQVEPAIFGTLLERALNPAERHALGAHYTPRAYVERLVLPTVIEPLRGEWANVQAAALLHANAGKPYAALDELDAFHHRLCQVRVLDPACGSANFLYVTLEHLKRLEGEVLDFAHSVGTSVGGGQQRLEAAGLTVDPHQFLGLEINPRAAAIAELVLWIGYLQWHFRTRGSGLPPQPILKDFRNIECRDAVLAYDGVELVRDEHGKPVTRWDGKTTKLHPVTGEAVPDETARIEVERYINPRPAEWPEADYIVGNPPFIGNKRMRDALGDGYVEALRSSWVAMPDSADFVMYWWHHAASLVRSGRAQGFGFITTNSLTQTFNRRVLEAALGAGRSERGEAGHASALMPPFGHPTGVPFGQKSGTGVPGLPAESAPERNATARELGLHLAFAIADHPWVDSADGAAVRIAMTVGATGQGEGRLMTVISEEERGGEGLDVSLAMRTGLVHADLRIGPNIAAAKPLRANELLANRGMIPHGEGFLVSPEDAATLDGGGLLKPYRNGKDFTDRPRGVWVIDTFGLAESELRARFPGSWQWLHDRVKPARDQNPRESRRKNWWLFAENQPRMRASVAGLPRYIATPQTAKHRLFQFLGTAILPDDKLIAVGLADAFFLGALCSSVHQAWALAAGATLEDRPVYNKSSCFDAFPFPAAPPDQQARIRDLAEQLDAHRKRQQAQHADLTLTGMYNVLEKLRSGEALNAREKAIHEKGLVSVLKTLHDELDRAVLDAYGWSDLAPLLGTEGFTEPVLERLVALNAERAREEAGGLIRWLRPEYQNPVAHLAGISSSHNLQKNRSDAAPAPTDAPPAVALGEGCGGQGFLAEGRHDAPVASLAEPPKRKTPATRTAAEAAEHVAANASASTPAPTRKPWPTTLPEQVAAVAHALADADAPLSEPELAARFTGKGPWKKRLPEILQTLVALGRAKSSDGLWTSCD